MCFRCRGGSRGVGGLTKLAGLVIPGVSAKERFSRARGEGEGGGEGGEARSVVFYEVLKL